MTTDNPLHLFSLVYGLSCYSLSFAEISYKDLEIGPVGFMENTKPNFGEGSTEIHAIQDQRY